MSLYKYIRETWHKPKENLSELWKERLIKWRKEPVTIRIDRPTRIDKARSLGYKAKQGIFVVRQRVLRGGRQRPKFARGRRPKHMRRKKIVNISYQVVAEQRAAKIYRNCEVLNSYLVSKDGRYYWYEVIFADRKHPSVLADKSLAWVAEPPHKGRAFRGVTSAARKSRGLRKKGRGTEHLRPSRKADMRRRSD